MRPASILMFERLFLASVALSVIGFLVSYEAAMEQLAGEPAVVDMGFGVELVVGLMVLMTAIYLLLWFLIAHKASTVAKWILIVFTVLGLAAFAVTLAVATVPWDLATMLNLAVYALDIAALVFLFRDDARAWFRREWSTDPAAFE